MLQFSAIYFDTNQLLKAGWPGLSTKMESLLSTARAVKVSAYLLHPVERELEAHCLREYEEANEKNAAIKALETVGIKVVLPTVDDYLR